MKRYVRWHRTSSQLQDEGQLWNSITYTLATLKVLESIREAHSWTSSLFERL